MMIMQSFHIEMAKINMYTMNVRTLWSEVYITATLSTFNTTVSGFIIPRLKSVGQFKMPKLINQKRQN